MSRSTPVGSMNLGDHCCLAFREVTDQREVLVAFVGDGLAGGQRVMYVTDATTCDELREWLAGSGLPPEDHVRSGQLVVVGASDFYLAPGYFDPAATVAGVERAAQAAIAAGYRGLRLTTEMGWALRGAPGASRLLEYEAMLQRAFDLGQLMAICQYDLRLFTADELADVQEAHPQIVTPNPMYADGLLRISRTLRPAGLRLTGDIVTSNVQWVASALAAVLREGEDVHLDLSGLQFCDIGGIKAMVAAAAGLARGRRLVLSGVPAHLRQVMRVVGWDGTPGLVIEGKQDRGRSGRKARATGTRKQMSA